SVMEGHGVDWRKRHVSSGDSLARKPLGSRIDLRAHAHRRARSAGRWTDEKPDRRGYQQTRIARGGLWIEGLEGLANARARRRVQDAEQLASPPRTGSPQDASNGFR